MTFTDPTLVHEPQADRAVPAAWGATIRDGLEHLVNPPACSVFNDFGQVIGSSGFGQETGEVLAAPDTWFDSSGMHNLDDDSRVTALLPGRYQVQAAVDWAGDNPSGYRVIVDLLVNGSQVVHGDTRFFGAQSTVHGILVFRTLILVAGDFVEVMVQHNAGADRLVALREFTMILASVAA